MPEMTEIKADVTNIEGAELDVQDVDWDALSVDLGGEEFVRTVVLCNVAT